MREVRRGYGAFQEFARVHAHLRSLGEIPRGFRRRYAVELDRAPALVEDEGKKVGSPEWPSASTGTRLRTCFPEVSGGRTSEKASEEAASTGAFPSRDQRKAAAPL